MLNTQGEKGRHIGFHSVERTGQDRDQTKTIKTKKKSTLGEQQVQSCTGYNPTFFTRPKRLTSE